MKAPELLGQLSGLHQMMAHLFESIPEEDCYRRFHPDLPPMAWLYGRSAYIEAYWLREVLQQDDDITARVHHLFGGEVEVSDEVCAQLPNRDHLLNWALELQDDHLMKLANPGMLPDHPLMEDGRLLSFVMQEQARLYELFLAQMSERRLQMEAPYLVSARLQALPPSEDHVDLQQGHYRVGAKYLASSRDNELPPQVVELHAFRMDKRPVSNGAYLGFIEAGGYEKPAFWSEAGWAWSREHSHHPHHWRQDSTGAWYSIGLNGPCDLVAEEPVSGLSQYEALAYANWVASLGGKLEGAVVQHEYQWEIAARSGEIDRPGQVWEWCANPFEAYTGYETPDHLEAATRDFEAGHFVLRGYCLHSQKIIQRPSYRNHARPEQRFGMHGTRLVFPPSKMPWHK